MADQKPGKSAKARTLTSSLKKLKTPTQQQTEEKKKKGPPGPGKR